MGDRQRAYAALGVTEIDLDAIRVASHRESELLARRLKQRVRKAFKRLTAELHPDRNGGDVEKTRFFDIVSRVVSEVVKWLRSRNSQGRMRLAARTLLSVRSKPVLQVSCRRVGVAKPRH